MATRTNELCYLSATEAIARFPAGRLSPAELTAAVIARSEAVNPKVNAYTYSFFDRAIYAAKAAGLRYHNATNRPLEGVPLVVKDGNAVAGEITSYLCRLPAGWDLSRCSAAARCGRHPACAHHHAGVRRGRKLLYATLGRDPQSLEFGLPPRGLIQ